MYLCRHYTDQWLMSKSSQSGTMMAPVPTKHQEEIVKWFYSNHFSDSLPCVFGIHLGRDITRSTNVMRFLPWSFTALHRSDDCPKHSVYWVGGCTVPRPFTKIPSAEDTTSWYVLDTALTNPAFGLGGILHYRCAQGPFGVCGGEFISLGPWGGVGHLWCIYSSGWCYTIQQESCCCWDLCQEGSCWGANLV